MNNCYVCDTPLIKREDATPQQIKERKFASEEHIIPNFLFGRLKSHKLICKGCNEKFGNDLEGSLSKQIIFADLFDFKKDRNENTEKRVQISNSYKNNLNENIYLTKGFKLWKESRGELGNGKRTFPNYKEAIQYLESEKRKDPNFDIEEAKKKLKNIDEEFEKTLFFENKKVDLILLERLITKIALNFYIFKGGKISNIQQLLPYVNGKIENRQIARRYFLPNCCNLNLGNDEISHLIFLKGDSKENLLYAYIELFNVHCFLVILNDNYIDLDFEEFYRWNYNSEENLSHLKINFSLFHNPFERLQYDELFIQQFLSDIKNQQIKRMNRIMEVIGRRYDFELVSGNLN